MPFKPGISGNPKGRTKGSRGKVVSDEEFAKMIMKREGIILERMLKIIKDGKDADAMKAGIKWMEWSIKLRENGGIIATKEQEDGTEETYEVEEKKTASGDNVVDIKKLVSTDYKS